MERFLKKLVLDAKATGFQDPEKGGWGPLAVSRRKILPGSAQLKVNGFILTSWKGQKTNSGSTAFGRTCALLKRKSLGLS